MTQKMLVFTKLEKTFTWATFPQKNFQDEVFTKMILEVKFKFSCQCNFMQKTKNPETFYELIFIIPAKSYSGPS